jgi:hypothetical protein
MCESKPDRSRIYICGREILEYEAPRILLIKCGLAREQIGGYELIIAFCISAYLTLLACKPDAVLPGTLRLCKSLGYQSALLNSELYPRGGPHSSVEKAPTGVCANVCHPMSSSCAVTNHADAIKQQ